MDYTKSMINQNILFTFVGNRDPYVEGSEEPGPVLSLLENTEFSRVYLFCTAPQYIERAKSVEEIFRQSGIYTQFRFINLDLESPVDYQEIYSKLKASVDTIMESIAHEKASISVLLDPGTPQMQTVWFLLVRGNYLNAKLLQGIPPRFAGGAYIAREVVIDEGVLPEIRVSDKSSGKRGGTWYVPDSERKIIGNAPAFKDAMDKALRFAEYDVSVLLQGETGCGKGLFARLIHDKSKRKTQPFIPVNCASISEQLAMSELFGHKKGAFTGAESDRLGQFRAADGGTIFLDEIGDLPLTIQPKLLRVLEEKKYFPVGSDKEIEVDVRIIAATNKELEKLVYKGEFRRDLFERLNQVTVNIPPLRERKGDIPALTDNFVEAWNSKYKERKGLSPETIQYLIDYPWPGNVRELNNTITTLCASGMSAAIGPELLPQKILAHFYTPKSLHGMEISIPKDGFNLKAMMYQIEKSYYQKALEKAGGNKEQAAKLLGLNSPAFRKALRERFEI